MIVHVVGSHTAALRWSAAALARPIAAFWSTDSCTADHVAVSEKVEDKKKLLQLNGNCKATARQLQLDAL